MDEIARFLYEHPPFSLLEFSVVEAIAAKVQIEYFAPKQDVLVYHGRASSYLYIIRRGSVNFVLEDAQGTQVLDTLGEGEIFGVQSLISQEAPSVTVRTREETLVYLLPLRIFEQLRRDFPVFAQFFSPSVIERLDRALRSHQDKHVPELYRLHLRDLARYALTVEPYTSIRTTAQMMRDLDASCAMVLTEPPGIVSDRDLRNRVVAVGLPDTSHIARVMTSPVLMLPADSLAFEGLMLMVESNIHHVPITENGRIIGIVTHTDLLREQSRSPLLLPRQLERARTMEDLALYANKVEDTAGVLLREGARIRDISRMVAIAHDALVKRLLEDAEAALGPPPCPYAWLVLGSEGRFEQTLRTDQDNALVYADDAPPEAEMYFAMLAEQVVEQLVACGFPRCPGDIMATNAQWRQPLHIWKRYFERWIQQPEEVALLRSAIFFDYRSIYGSLNVEEELRPIVVKGRGQRIFLARMARTVLRQSPPIGFFRNFVLEQSGADRDLIDLKTRGTALVVDLARLYALEAGSAETNTLMRLRVASSSSSLNPSTAEELSSAYELINLFRLRHQYQQIQDSEQPTNHLPVSRLTKLEQRDLKEAFRAIASCQRSVEFAFQTNFLG